MIAHLTFTVDLQGDGLDIVVLSLSDHFVDWIGVALGGILGSRLTICDTP